jgi:hypothetical protein
MLADAEGHFTNMMQNSRDMKIGGLSEPKLPSPCNELIFICLKKNKRTEVALALLRPQQL